MGHRIRAHRRSWLCSDSCLFPPYCVCCHLLYCPTLYLYSSFPKQEAKVAAAHRLTLRERSLLYEVDAHYSYSALASYSEATSTGSSAQAVPACCDPGGVCPPAFYGTLVPQHREVLRLVDVGEIRVEAGEPPDLPPCCCGEHITPDQLIVTTSGARAGAVCAIAGPADAAGFVSLVQEQQRRVIQEGLDPAPPSAERGGVTVDGMWVPSPPSAGGGVQMALRAAAPTAQAMLRSSAGGTELVEAPIKAASAPPEAQLAN